MPNFLTGKAPSAFTSLNSTNQSFQNPVGRLRSFASTPTHSFVIKNDLSSLSEMTLDTYCPAQTILILDTRCPESAASGSIRGIRQTNIYAGVATNVD
jgi:hypothetical protein